MERARAAVIVAPGRAELTSVDVPDPGPGQVLIRLEGSGVCGSHLPLWEGRQWFTYPQEPGAPGHEGWGIVEAVGEGVRDVTPGDRVAALSYRAFADYDVAESGHVVRLPPALDGAPIPGEALACAMNAFHRAGIRAGQHVAVIGVGFLGALMIQLAADAGARVVGISRRPFALEVARACGAADAVPLADYRQAIERVRDFTGGRFCDRVIEATGLQEPLDLAGQITRERGRLVIAGFHQDGPRRVDMFLWNWRGLDVINAHEREPAIYVRGMREAVAAVANGRLDLRPLGLMEFPLERLDTALDAARTRPDGFLKALVRT